MIPVPTLADISAFSGRPESSYSGYVTSAALQAAIQFTIVTELTPSDYEALAPDDLTLAQQGVIAMSDWIYLRQPYQAVIANPLQGETIGSYTYSKPMQMEMRNLQAQELGAAQSGVLLWDLAVQYLSKRLRAAGVYHGQIMGFERQNTDARYSVTAIRFNHKTGQCELLGPEDFDKYDIPYSVSAEVFPSDPGVG